MLLPSHTRTWNKGGHLITQTNKNMDTWIKGVSYSQSYKSIYFYSHHYVVLAACQYTPHMPHHIYSALVNNTYPRHARASFYVGCLSVHTPNQTSAELLKVNILSLWVPGWSTRHSLWEHEEWRYHVFRLLIG